jgi:hypothetical protein
MKRSYNNGLVLLRFLGVFAILVGTFGIAYAALMLALRLFGLEGELMDSLWSEALRSVVTGPFWVACGFITLKLSPRLARWIARPCIEEQTSSGSP